MSSNKEFKEKLIKLYGDVPNNVEPKNVPDKKKEKFNRAKVNREFRKRVEEEWEI